MTRYVRTPAGERTFHEPIGSPIVPHPSVRMVRKSPTDILAEAKAHAARKTAEARAEGRNPLLPRPQKPPHPDAFLGDEKTTTESIHLQEFAQSRAQKWYQRIADSEENTFRAPDEPLTDEEASASLWSEYQMPAMYGKINDILRDNKTVDGITPAQMRHYVDYLFNSKASTVVSKPMTVYRALKGKRSGEPKDIDWRELLKPGTVFEDDGMVSTTAYPKFAQGWLHLGHNGDSGRPTQLDDVVMEIRIPSGTRVVGGSTQFIETMLRPGTRLRIISSETKMSHPENPLGSSWLDDPLVPSEYTHVVAEVVQ